MRNDTRALYTAYTAAVAQMNGVDDVAKRFNVDPSVSQKLEVKAQESSAFLSSINLYPVDELRGATVGITSGGMIASRTNTQNGSGAVRRQPKDPSGLVDREYQLAKTNFDTMLAYAKLDTWAKFSDFAQRIQGAILETIALNRIAIGWNGTSVAATTNPATNPLGQDVNKGWIQYLREQAPTNILSEGGSVNDKITVGPGGDYATLDSLAWDLRQQMPSWARGRTDLVVITGSQLLHDKYFPLINKDRDPTEQIARDLIMSAKRLGNMQASEVPFFPEDALLITPLSNLSIYYQDGKRRRHIVEEPQYDRVADYQSSNEGYVIEDTDLAIFAENIAVLDKDGDGVADA